MSGRWDKQTVLGLLLVVLLAAGGGYLLWKNSNPDQIQRIDQGKSQDTQTQLLTDALQSQLSSKSLASFQIISGSGSLQSGPTWQFAQSIPQQLPGGNDRDGNPTDPLPAPLGNGGRLEIRGVTSQSNLQDLLRSTLSDLGLKLRQSGGKTVLVSSKLVSAPFKTDGDSLIVDHLFLRSDCTLPEHHSEVVLLTSCQVTPVA